MTPEEYESYWALFTGHTIQYMHDMGLRAYPTQNLVESPYGWIVWHKSVAECEAEKNKEVLYYYSKYYNI